jgi:hypothetical protein
MREQGLGTLEVIEHALKPFDIVKVLIYRKLLALKVLNV